MKNDLTQEQLTSIFDYDPETGIFRRRSTGRVNGAPNEHGYLGIAINRHCYKAHRLAWLYVYGEWPAGELDHENLQRGDNRISNLRPATRRQNKQNMTKARSDSKTGILGITPLRSGNFGASIKDRDGKRLWLGTYKTAEEAQAAYLAAKAVEHPFARTT